MKKYFIISDVHGFYDEMIDALTNSGFDINNSNHFFISCGDLLDRGNKPRECLQFVNNLYAQGRAILIKGNHETLMEEMLQRGEPLSYDYSNGTVKTVLEMFSNCNDINLIWTAMQNDNDYIDYKSHLVDFYEIDKYVFVHGWIPCMYNRQFNAYHPLNDWRDGDWEEARWFNGFNAWNDGVKVEGKTIICGHWHTAYAHNKYHNMNLETTPFKECYSPFVDKGIIGIDACTAYTKFCNCIIIEEE